MKQKFQDLMARLTARTTLFCGAFFISGHILHLLHRLDATYITFMGTLLGFIVGHSVSENLKPPQKDDKPGDKPKVDDPDK